MRSGRLDHDGQEIYEREIRSFFILFESFSGLSPERSDGDLIENYINQCYPRYIMDEGRLVSHINSVRRWCLKHNKNLRPGTGNHQQIREEPLFLSREEILKLLRSAAYTTVGIMIRLILATGARLTEICDMKVDQLDVDHSRVIISNNHDGMSYPMNIPEKLMYYLARLSNYKSPDEFLFNIYHDENGRSKRITERTFHRQMDRFVRSARLPAITAVGLRDTHIMHLLLQGYDATAIMDRLNIKSSKTRKKYLILSEKLGVIPTAPPFLFQAEFEDAGEV